METCGQQEKAASSRQILLEIVLQIENIFSRYAELSRFGVGWTKFPFYEVASRKGERAV